MGCYLQSVTSTAGQFREMRPFSAMPGGFGTNHIAAGRSNNGQQERGNALREEPEG